MIKLRLATPDNRQQLIIDGDETPMDILQDNEVVLEGASINLDGIPLTRDEFYKPFSELVRAESATATLSVVVKTGNA